MISWIKSYFDKSWREESYRNFSLGNRLLIISPLVIALAILAILEEAGAKRGDPISLVIIVAGFVGFLVMAVFSHYRWFVGSIRSNAFGPSAKDTDEK